MACVALGLALAAATGAAAATRSGDGRGGDCAALRSLRFPGASITAAGLAAEAKGPPACRLEAEVRTSASSTIRVAVWMPAEAWNHRFLATGWAFYAGTMNPALLAGPVSRGYATATTDGGGTPGRPAFFLANPEKVRDWGERAWHVTTVFAKAAIRAYYGEPAAFAYWNGGGGSARQGLKEAQRFPADYDGVVVGGLAHDTSHFAFAQVAEWQAVHAGAPVRASVLPRLHRAAVAACDAQDGDVDGLIGDPEACRFDPAALACPDTARDDCLTAAEVAAFRKLYAPVRNPRSGAVIFGGLARGSELTWKDLIEAPEPQSYALDFFRYIVFQDPAWNVASLDFDRDVARAEGVAPSVNATDPDLRPFFRRGGKLLIWGGWSDNAIPPSANTAYARAVARRLGVKPAANGMRLFMVPGMAHFPGRTGADAYDFDSQALIEAWRERGEPPAALAVTHWSNGVQDRSFPVCPYPLPPRDGACPKAK